MHPGKRSVHADTDVRQMLVIFFGRPKSPRLLYVLFFESKVAHGQCKDPLIFKC